MTSRCSVLDGLARAESLAEVLDAGYDAFEQMLVVIRKHDDPSTELFVPMVMAGAAAGGGRDAIMFAPSLPPRPLHVDQRVALGLQAATARLAASWLLSVCGLLADRLTASAESAIEPGDRAACLNAARYARDIHGLMGGDRP